MFLKEQHGEKARPPSKNENGHAKAVSEIRRINELNKT